MFYCKDATKIFLEKNSVDLFVTHPPYESSKTVELYGNDEYQIHNANKSLYLDRLLKIVLHMIHALKDNGRILLGVPARPIMYEIVAMLVQNVEHIEFEAPVVWEFGSDEIYDGYADTQVYFLNIIKGSPRPNQLKNLIVDIPWVPNVELYEYAGFVDDSVPIELCDIIIDSFTDEGDTVADLMGGTGSILLSAKNKNRNIIYNDVSESQFNIAKQRLL